MSNIGELIQEHETEIATLKIQITRITNELTAMENRLLEHDIKPKIKEKIVQFIKDKKRTLKYLITIIISGGSIAKVILYLVENDLVFDFISEFLSFINVIGYAAFTFNGLLPLPHLLTM